MANFAAIMAILLILGTLCAFPAEQAANNSEENGDNK